VDAGADALLEEMHVDRRVAAIAGCQHGVIATRQLYDLGVQRGWISYRLQRGLLHRVYRGVYLVGHAVAPPLAREMAAVLTFGADTFVSHGRAAAAWQLWSPPPSALMEVTISGRRPVQRRGIRVHTVDHLDPADVGLFENIPITEPARTILDLAAMVDRRTLAGVVEHALVTRRVSRRGLEGAIARAPLRRGAAVLRDLLAAGDEPALTRSEAERRMRELIRVSRLPAPELNVRVGRYEVDLLWRTEQVIVEIDGFAFHRSREAFERDRRRDRGLEAQGFLVVRVTWRALVDEPEAVIADLAATLARRHVRA
jgi:very-short-patch-repair endonuclease